MNPQTVKIIDLIVSARIKNCLSAVEIYTIQDLFNASSEFLLKLRNFGNESLRELHATVRKYPQYESSIFPSTYHNDDWKTYKIKGHILRKEMQIARLNQEIMDLKSLL